MNFERIATQPGLHLLRENPCSLLSFGKLSLEPGDTFEGNTGHCEGLIVTLCGQARVRACGVEFEQVGGRRSVFDGRPHAVYLPPDCTYEVSASEDGIPFEAAVPMARADDGSAPFLIGPDDVWSTKRGIANFSEEVCEILVQGQHPGRRIRRLVVGETLTPSGNWSGYPPHRHELDDPPNEAAMEEMNYFRVSPGDGWGLAKHYSDDGDADSVYTVADNSILMMPKGYHTVVSAPGCVTYCLWFLAGETRSRAARVDPRTQWVTRAIPMIRNMKENLA